MLLTEKGMAAILREEQVSDELPLGKAGLLDLIRALGLEGAQRKSNCAVSGAQPKDET